VSQIEGQESDDLQDALKEVLRLVEDDFTSGFDHNENRFLTGFSID
jgi:hypothetical protein